MYKQILLFLTIFFASFTASADIGGNIHLLKGEGALGTATVEYYWNQGDCTGYGFYDAFNSGSLDYITENLINCSILDSPFYVSGELSRTNFGDFQKAGIGVQLHELLGSVGPFEVIDLTYYGKAWGEKAEQTLTVWRSKSLSLTEYISVYASGFGRIMRDQPDIIQSQIWFKSKSSPIEIGIEHEVYDGEVTWYLALKYTF